MKTITTIALLGAAGIGGYLLYQKLKPAPAPKPRSSALGEAFAGVAELITALRSTSGGGTSGGGTSGEAKMAPADSPSKVTYQLASFQTSPTVKVQTSSQLQTAGSALKAPADAPSSSTATKPLLAPAFSAGLGLTKYSQPVTISDSSVLPLLRV